MANATETNSPRPKDGENGDGQPENCDTGVNSRIQFFNSISVQPQEEQSGQSQEQELLMNISQSNEEQETVEIETHNDVRHTICCNNIRTIVIICIMGVVIVILFAVLIAEIVHKSSKQHEICEKKQLIGPQNDPFFTIAFPQKGSTVTIKCFLPFKGNYSIHTIFEKENKDRNVTDICSGDIKYHYKLYCDKDHRTCEDTVCSYKCTKFDISLSEMQLVLLDLDDSCLALNGRIEIWNSTIKVIR